MTAPGPAAPRTPARRGRLTVYLGAAPGVGKTFAMLDEGRRRAGRGTDVVIGLVETHGREDTARAAEGLEVVPRRTVTHGPTTLTELDVDAILARAPQVALVDELAHTDVAARPPRRRWEDVRVLLDAGIDVLTTVNVQHLESLGDDVEAITGVRQRETVPDRVVREADQIQLVDLSPQALRRRLAHGKVYRPEQVDASLASYFREGNLTALRELALLWTADRVDDALVRYRTDHDITGTWPTRERVLVAVTGGPEGATLLRRGARIAARGAGSELHAVHVLASDGLPGAGPEQVAAARTLVESLGGTFHTVVGEDVPQAVVDLARGIDATMIVVGTSRHSRWREALLGSTSTRVAELAGSIDVHLVTHDAARSVHAVRPGLSPLSRARQVTGWLLAVALPVLLALGLRAAGDADDAAAGSSAALPLDVVLYLVVVVAVALVGGRWPAVLCAVLAFGCLNWFFTPPTGRLTVASTQDVLTLLVFVVVAVAVATVVDVSARRAVAATRARAEAGALASLSRSVLSGQDSTQAVLARLVETFPGVRSARLEEREVPDGAGEGGAGTLAAASGTGVGAVDDDAWHAVAQAEATTPRPGVVRTVVPAGEGRRLVLHGATLPASDRRVLEAYAAQAGAVLERRELRARAARAAALEQGEAARTAVFSAVSHDLRTPLAAIRASVDGLRAGDVHLDDEDRRALVDTVEAGTTRLERLVDNLLDLSRLQAGGVRAVLEPSALDEVVPLAVEPYGDAVTLDVPDSLPLVRTDAGLLERVLANLVSNAVRYQRAGTPVRVVGAADARTVQVRVVDTGPGLDDDAKVRALAPFERLGETSSGGLGLGLAVADGLARAVGATLTAEDTPGGGLTMVVTVPRDVP